MDIQICKRLILAITLGALLFSIPAFAKKGAAPGGHLQINEVVWVDGDPDTLLISGVDFDFGDGDLVVTLGEEGALVINNASATEIEVVVPDLPAGDYLLSVFRQGGQSQGDEYDLTIGAACSITECVDPGEATLTCGATSVTVLCMLPCPIDWRAEKASSSWIGQRPSANCTTSQTLVANSDDHDFLEIFTCPGTGSCDFCPDGGAEINVNNDWRRVCLSVDETIACSQTLIEYMKQIPETVDGDDPATCRPVQP